MIDNTDLVFQKVSTKLRETYPGIYVTGRKMHDIPPQFPAISITTMGNPVATKYSTFESVENAVQESYEFDVNSNLTVGREQECRDIMNTVDEVMSQMYFIRNFNESVSGIDTTIARRIARYTILSTGGN